MSASAVRDSIAFLQELSGRVAALEGAQAVSGLGVIVSGANAATPRGTQFEHYLWMGTVLPENMAANDLFVRN